MGRTPMCISKDGTLLMTTPFVLAHGPQPLSPCCLASAQACHLAQKLSNRANEQPSTSVSKRKCQWWWHNRAGTCAVRHTHPHSSAPNAAATQRQTLRTLHLFKSCTHSKPSVAIHTIMPARRVPHETWSHRRTWAAAAECTERRAMRRRTKSLQPILLPTPRPRCAAAHQGCKPPCGTMATTTCFLMACSLRPVDVWSEPIKMPHHEPFRTASINATDDGVSTEVQLWLCHRLVAVCPRVRSTQLVTH